MFLVLRLHDVRGNEHTSKYVIGVCLLLDWDISWRRYFPLLSLSVIVRGEREDIFTFVQKKCALYVVGAAQKTHVCDCNVISIACSWANELSIFIY